MTRPVARISIACVVLLALFATAAHAQQVAQQSDQRAVQTPVLGVAHRSAIPAEKQALLKRHADHPMVPFLEWAYGQVDRIAAIKDYTATFSKRERVGGELLGHQYLFVKVRHEPMSVYTHFLSPRRLKGQEAIWIRGRNGGKLVAHAPPGTFRYRLVGMVNLNPGSSLAMRGNRHPITNTGILHLTREIIRIGENDLPHGECELTRLEGVKVQDRKCSRIEVTHPHRRQHFAYHIARIYIDDELNVPIRFESYDWPAAAGGQPRLLEEYTYVNLKLNVGLTERDFDHRNPDYRYLR